MWRTFNFFLSVVCCTSLSTYQKLSTNSSLSLVILPPSFLSRCLPRSNPRNPVCIEKLWKITQKSVKYHVWNSDFMHRI